MNQSERCRRDVVSAILVVMLEGVIAVTIGAFAAVFALMLADLFALSDMSTPINEMTVGEVVPLLALAGGGVIGSIVRGIIGR